MLPPGTAKRHWQPSSGDDRAQWKAGKAMIRRLRPRPFTWNGGRQQKRPFHRSEFQVEANCFHPERPNGTGSPPTATTVPSGKPEDRSRTGRPPTATTVPGGGAEKGNGTGKPPKRMSVPDGKTRRTRMDSSLPRPFTWNGGWPQKRPFPRSEFQVEAICFHLERPKGTGDPLAATYVPGGKPESGKAQQKNRRTLQPGGPKTYCANPYIA